MFRRLTLLIAPLCATLGFAPTELATPAAPPPPRIAIGEAIAPTDDKEEEKRPYPAEVTAETRADRKVLARLQKPGKVFFQEGFEGKDHEPWYNRIGEKEGRVRFLQDEAKAHRGTGVLELETVDRDGKSCGAGTSYWFHPGYDCVYFRRYIRFSEDYDQGNLNHVGGSLYAVAGSNRWGEMGKAGVRPEGNDSFGASFEPWCDWKRLPPPGAMMLYTYWMDMKRDRDGNYWGNVFQPTEADRKPIKRGQWYCLEQMIRVGTPGKAEGEMAAWIDGELYIHLTGFRWCKAPLRLKRIFLDLYVHASRRTNMVWYDDIALSTGYIGPIRSRDQQRQ